METTWRVVWKQIGEGSPAAHELGVPEGSWLPFAVAGDKLAAYDDNDTISLSYLDLVRGMVLGMADHWPEVDSEAAKDRFPDVLAALTEILGAPDIETLIQRELDVIRTEWGLEAAAAARAGADALRPGTEWT